MNAGEAIDAALARAREFSDKVPSSRGVMLYRLNARQQQLFSRIADVEPEYFGQQVIVALTGNSYDLANLSPLAERLTMVQISDPGSSSYQAGDEINIVPIMDRHCALAPRVYLRDNVLDQVDADLVGVAEIEIFYSKRATALTTEAVDLELPEQFQELLPIDLARHQLRKTVDIAPEARKVAIDSLTLEENELLADMDRHLEHWRFAETARARHSQKAQLRPRK